ncbi:SDR family NAD(P)-dependent oxidoreductase [Enterococcus crotali]|uniref:SDR family NAD(P)-dependent oxidoreductase n=1 Tax=Enterococcus crotali TaxID=1453587 RepID=UPI00046F03D9|nr:SDR family oxidoreductase [Enterococcus crotali]
MKKSIIIVGAGQGVGLETARKFGKEGYKVGLIRRGQENLTAMSTELANEGVETFSETADANRPEDIATAVQKLGERMSGIDVLFYNVPGPLGKAYMPATQITTKLLSEFLTMRVLSALSSAQAAIPFLKSSKGSLLFTSGQSDRSPFPYTAAIGAPQAALRLLAEHLSEELKSDDIFVGYLPLDNPPLYSDPEKELEREDLPEGFSLKERVVAKDVADVIYDLNQKRDVFERPVKASKSE